MKITIKGHPTRGKEVIQILESLGGKNTSNHKGKDNYAYYISKIDCPAGWSIFLWSYLTLVSSNAVCVSQYAVQGHFFCRKGKIIRHKPVSSVV